MDTYNSSPIIGQRQAPQVFEPQEQRSVRRQEQAAEAAGLVPVETMSPAEVGAYNQYLNTTLGHIDSLRYPAGLPQLQKRAQEPESDRKDRSAEAAGSMLAAGTTIPQAPPGSSTVDPPSSLQAVSTGENRTRAAGSGTAKATGRDMEYYNKTAAEMGHTVGADGKQAALSGEQRNILAAGLSRYDPAVLDRLKEMGLKINIYDHTKAPEGGFPNGGPDGFLGEKNTWKENVAGYYERDSKTLCLRRDSFSKGMNNDSLNTITHETGHAIDDMLEADYPGSGRGDLMSFKDKKLDGLYNKYMERTATPHPGANDPLWSDYARTSSSEYFAEGTMKYVAGGKDRESLKKADPGLFSYVQQKLDRARGPLPEYKAPPPPTAAESRKFREMYTLPGDFTGAMLTGNKEEAKKLVAEFPDFLKKGPAFGGLSPVTAAMMGEKPKEMLEFLIASGADINAKDANGQTTLQVLQEAGRNDLVQILRAHGAR
jgi:hypothetical protein